ncbi:MAG TPA: hypothetical protein VFR37_15835, partial [Longimicrobium sp.]|nr:hypothetical protein [Longimicrobium sp.]
MDVEHLTGPARDCVVPREPMFDLGPDQRAQKPLWTLDEAFDAIDAFEDAGAAVVEGEILAAAADGTVSQLPWEPWLPGDHDPRYPPTKRRWWLR